MSCSSGCSGCSGFGLEPDNNILESTKINRIIGVLSGKGGVGKTMVSSLLAVELAKQGYKVGVMDADITGPSIPKIFGLENTEIYGDEKGVYPSLSNKYNIKIVSINMMLEDDEKPVVWRGPIIGNMIKQFYQNVYWEELDYLIIDMPPGTGDVALNVVQDIPIDGLLMVTNPGKLVNMIVAKTINMAKLTKVKVLGLVENMSYIKCDNCHHNIRLYSDYATNELMNKYGLNLLAKIPLDQNLSQLCETGKIEDYNDVYLNNLVNKI